jgi:hypothetical protein
MTYGVEFDSWADAEYLSWDIPIEVYDEIERRLATELALEPTRYLRRVGANTAALQYTCRVVEQGISATVHFFLFRVRYSQDEQTLIIWDRFHFPLRG